MQDSPDLNTIEKSTLRLDRILPAVRDIACTRLGHERPTSYDTRSRAADRHAVGIRTDGRSGLLTRLGAGQY